MFGWAAHPVNLATVSVNTTEDSTTGTQNSLQKSKCSSWNYCNEGCSVLDSIQCFPCRSPHFRLVSSLTLLDRSTSQVLLWPTGAVTGLPVVGVASDSPSTNTHMLSNKIVDIFFGCHSHQWGMAFYCALIIYHVTVSTDCDSLLCCTTCLWAD